LEIQYIFILILVLATFFSYFNHKFIHLPAAVGLMLLGLLLSLVLLALGAVFPAIATSAESMLKRVDFSDLLLNFMLSLLLFAGALLTDTEKLSKAWGPVLTYATVSVLISTFAIGSMVYFTLDLFHLDMTYVHCLLLGAILAPTDPVAVLGILRETALPDQISVRVAGESLFNDGVGVVLFIILYQFGAQEDKPESWRIPVLLLKEAGGGVVLGFILGYLGVGLLKTLDHYQTEVMLTLSLVLGGYSLANYLGLSGPLAVVVAGLLIGGKGRKISMSETTLDYVDKFWEMIHEILNAFLFVLIGFEILLLEFRVGYILIGLLTALIVLATRYMALALPSVVLGWKRIFSSSSLIVMTWAGLKGGISIALALSLRPPLPRSPIVAITYVVVLFSILVQGLSIRKVVKAVMRKEDETAGSPPALKG